MQICGKNYKKMNLTPSCVDFAESASRFGGDILGEGCQVSRYLKTGDHHFAVGRGAGTSGAAEDSRKDRTVPNFDTYAGYESERKIAVRRKRAVAAN
jgi:hypothetical protein